MADSICPTSAAGTISLITGRQSSNHTTPQPYLHGVSAQNNDWNNGCLTQSVAPTFSTSLLDFGNTGRQS